MTPSSLHQKAHAGLHVAIIMDGNGRWAAARNLPREAGHRVGADAVRRTVEAAPEAGIGVLTLYAFSSDNWSRPRREVSALMKLLRIYLLRETKRCIADGLRVSFIGRRDRLPPILVSLIEETEQATAAGTKLHLRIALDYSSRDAILRAAERIKAEGEVTRDAFGRLIHEAGGSGPVPDVDLLIRTSGEQRLSDFLLWESAYAELYFTPRMWPDFDANDLAQAIADYGSRQRRFGNIAAAG